MIARTSEWSRSVTCSTIRREPHRHLLFTSRSVASRLTHPTPQSFLRRAHSGWSLTHSCSSTKISSVKMLKRLPRERKIRSPLKLSKSSTKSPSTLPQWSAALRLWSEWSCRMLRVRSFMTTSTTKTIPATPTLSPLALFSLFGASPLRSQRGKTLPPCAGTLATRICSPCPMVPTNSWSKLAV